MLISWIHFLANLLITGFLLRILQAKYPDTALGRALMFVY